MAFTNVRDFRSYVGTTQGDTYWRRDRGNPFRPIGRGRAAKQTQDFYSGASNTYTVCSTTPGEKAAINSLKRKGYYASVDNVDENNSWHFAPQCPRKPSEIDIDTAPFSATYTNYVTDPATIGAGGWSFEEAEPPNQRQNYFWTNTENTGQISYTGTELTYDASVADIEATDATSIRTAIGDQLRVDSLAALVPFGTYNYDWVDGLTADGYAANSYPYYGNSAQLRYGLDAATIASGNQSNQAPDPAQKTVEVVNGDDLPWSYSVGASAGVRVSAYGNVDSSQTMAAFSVQWKGGAYYIYTSRDNFIPPTLISYLDYNCYWFGYRDPTDGTETQRNNGRPLYTLLIAKGASITFTDLNTIDSRHHEASFDIAAGAEEFIHIEILSDNWDAELVSTDVASLLAGLVSASHSAGQFQVKTADSELLISAFDANFTGLAYNLTRAGQKLRINNENYTIGTAGSLIDLSLGYYTIPIVENIASLAAASSLSLLPVESEGVATLAPGRYGYNDSGLFYFADNSDKGAFSITNGQSLWLSFDDETTWEELVVDEAIVPTPLFRYGQETPDNIIGDGYARYDEDYSTYGALYLAYNDSDGQSGLTLMQGLVQGSVIYISTNGGSNMAAQTVRDAQDVGNGYYRIRLFADPPGGNWVNANDTPIERQEGDWIVSFSEIISDINGYRVSFVTAPTTMPADYEEEITVLPYDPATKLPQDNDISYAKIVVSTVADTSIDFLASLLGVDFRFNRHGEAINFNGQLYDIHYYEESVNVIKFATPDSIASLVADAGSSLPLTATFDHIEQKHSYYAKNGDKLTDVDLHMQFYRHLQNAEDYYIKNVDGTQIKDPLGRVVLKMYSVDQDLEFELPYQPLWTVGPTEAGGYYGFAIPLTELYNLPDADFLFANVNDGTNDADDFPAGTCAIGLHTIEPTDPNLYYRPNQLPEWIEQEELIIIGMEKPDYSVRTSELIAVKNAQPGYGSSYEFYEDVKEAFFDNPEKAFDLAGYQHSPKTYYGGYGVSYRRPMGTGPLYDQHPANPIELPELYPDANGLAWVQRAYPHRFTDPKNYLTANDGIRRGYIKNIFLPAGSSVLDYSVEEFIMEFDTTFYWKTSSNILDENSLEGLGFTQVTMTTHASSDHQDLVIDMSAPDYSYLPEAAYPASDFNLNEVEYGVGIYPECEGGNNGGGGGSARPDEGLLYPRGDTC